MKRQLITAIMIFIMVLSGNAQTCCRKADRENTSTHAFARLGNDAAFKEAHSPPEPLHYQTRGEIRQIPVAGDKDARIYELTSKSKTLNYILVFHEWWGLNKHIMKEAERLQKDLGKVNVIAVDLYDGQTAEDAEKASGLMQAADEKRIRAIIEAVKNYVGPKAAIQTIGWCFGGGWSLQAALMMGEQMKGCVMYYGMPESDVEKLKTLHCPLLGIFASRDQWITREMVLNFQQSLRAARKSFTLKSYSADHAFANPSNPNYDRENAEKAYREVVSFMKENWKNE